MRIISCSLKSTYIKKILKTIALSKFWHLRSTFPMISIYVPGVLPTVPELHHGSYDALFSFISSSSFTPQTFGSYKTSQHPWSVVKNHLFFQSKSNEVQENHTQYTCKKSPLNKKVLQTIWASLETPSPL